MKKIKKWSELVPEKYQKEYLKDLANLTRSRTRLLCALTVVIYFLGNFLSYFFIPGTFKVQEVGFMAVILAASTIIFLLTAKAKKLATLKTNAYLFTATVLFMLTKSSLLYPEHFYFSASLYLFMLFLVFPTIPWAPVEIVPITAIVMGAYSALYFLIKTDFPQALVPGVAIYDYVSGLIIIFLGALLCMIVRRKDMTLNIENFLFLKDIQEKQAQMTKELELATRIHKTLIPKSLSTDLVDVAVMYLPMYYIGGDYAKFHFIDKKRLVFIICDVTGHGVSAALLVNRIHTEFERLATEHKYPGPLLDELNEFIISDFGGTQMYLSAFCCMLDFGSMKMSYSNHGHPPQYLYRVSNAQIEPLPSQEPLLGFEMPEEKGVQNEVDFSQGDKLVFFTDGVTENKSPSGDEYGMDRLEKFISDNHSLPADKFNTALSNDLKDFNEGTLSDDIFLVAIDLKEHKGWI